ncbi:MAG TPA: VapE family protein, partial [Verrucomicrobiota bacterium]|nr:VapE family protein [Verrucomicrobiota bacterium]
APTANIGVPTGLISGLAVLDVDTLKGGEDSLFDLTRQFGPLPDTVAALTGGGGQHFLFAHPGPGVKIRNSVENLGPGLDVRGDGGYIIVAPSTHVSGRTYEWELSCHPKDIALAPLPEWLLARIIDHPRPALAPVTPGGGKLSPREIQRIRAALRYLDPEPYDVWILVGMALHAAGDDDQGFDLWTQWAGKSGKFDPDDHQRRWASFTRTGSGVTLGTLFASAKAAGYAPPSPPPPSPPPPPDTPPGGFGGEGSDDWESTLRRNGKGRPDSTPGNIELILQHHADWAGLLAWDEMSYRTVKRRPPPYAGGKAGEWTDADDIWTSIWLEKHYEICPRPHTVAQVVAATAQLAPFHQVRSWLASLPPWDGIERLAHFFVDACGAALNPYTEAVGRAFFISAVARVMQPGCKVDTMLTLEGKQGVGKSQLILALFSAQWHIEISYAPGSLDFFQSLRGCWCAEFGELSQFDRADTNKIKQVLTQVQDTYRASYGSHAMTYPRQVVFVGSTNRREWGFDETGMRRFLPITCTEINLDYVRDHREALWAEALQRFQAGESWWDIPDAEREQNARYDYDAWEELVSDWVENKERFALPGAPVHFGINEVYEKAIYGNNARHIPPISRGDQVRLGRVLTRLGWRRKRLGDGKREYGYERAPA